MKFSQIAKGKRATTDATLYHEGKEYKVKLRPLDMGEELDCIAAAMKYAVSRGVKEPKPGNAVYDASLWAETLALSCLDAENDEQPFFDSKEPSAQVRSMDEEAIAMLFEQQRAWQEECSPGIQLKTGSQIVALAKAIAEDPNLPLWELSPRTRQILLRFTASHAVNSPGFKQYSSSNSEVDSTGLFARPKRSVRKSTPKSADASTKSPA